MVPNLEEDAISGAVRIWDVVGSLFYRDAVPVQTLNFCTALDLQTRVAKRNLPLRVILGDCAPRVGELLPAA